jgi:hypothetical protein
MSARKRTGGGRLRDADLFPRQPGGVLDGLLDVRALEVRVAGKDLLG